MSWKVGWDLSPFTLVPKKTEEKLGLIVSVHPELHNTNRKALCGRKCVNVAA